MKIPKLLTTVVPFSKFTLIFLFVILPFLGFYSGVRYQTETSSNTRLKITPVLSDTPFPAVKNSGIYGQILLGPTCPVERAGQNCTKPYQGTVIIETLNRSREITRFTSDKNGNFRVILNQGNYYLVPLSSNVFPRGMPQTVRVYKNSFAKITVTYDTGIR